MELDTSPEDMKKAKEISLAWGYLFPGLWGGARLIFSPMSTSHGCVILDTTPCLSELPRMMAQFG